ncbi:MAG: amidohydrolase family protein [Saprospiraceae bacterium]|nr:amidohydrolase family protein [Saprospiraceae bacterium]
MNKLYILLIFIVFGFSAEAQMVNKSQKGTFLLKDATLHTVTNGTIQGDLLIKDGKIAEIGTITQMDAGSTTIMCTGMHVYPGFIDGGTNLGLSEVGSISLTQDYRELGDFTPHMQALTAVNPNSVAIPVTRTNGVTSVISKTAGGLFPGTAALINLHGYTPNQMFAGFKAVQMNFPSTGKRGRWDRRKPEDIKKDGEKAMKKMNDIWDKARQYAAIDSAAKATNQKMDDFNPQMEALMPIVRGEAKLMIEVNKDNDIKAAIKWVEKNKLDVIFTGVSEGYRVAKELAKSGIPVITGPVLSVPGRSSASYDVSYKNPSIMHKAGVKVAIRSNETENVRNLPFNAGFAAAYGMGVEEALKSITIIPAEILGVSDQLGSLEKGKIANIFISNGDPFETKTQIEHLFINGYKVPMESRHTLLYDEFLERDPGAGK